MLGRMCTLCGLFRTLSENRPVTVSAQIAVGKENVPVSCDNVLKPCRDNRDTPVTKTVVEDPDSQDSGLGADKEDVPEILHPNFQFVEPHSLPPRRLKLVQEDSPLKSEQRPRICSCPALMCGLNVNTNCLSYSTLETSRSNIINEDEDDGFLESATDSIEESDDALSLSHLITSPLLTSEFYVTKTNCCSQLCIIDQETSKIKPRCNSTLSTFSNEVNGKFVHFKRPDPPCDLTAPNQTKRRKSVCLDITHTSQNDDQERIQPKCGLLQRCHSETEATIKRALQRGAEEPDLIGDFSKPYTLPCVLGKHQDLKSISPETLSKLLNHQYCNSVDNFIIVDCRYPYEYDGGHIRNAKNIFTKEGIIKEFLSFPPVINSKENRTILIFHCEFSSERGPSLTRFLRNKDRNLNKECYPRLHYPELYILHGGYKAFYECFKELCDPQEYKPMLHKDHENDLRHFRAKSKSWNGDHKGPAIVRPGLKL